MPRTTIEPVPPRLKRCGAPGAAPPKASSEHDSAMLAAILHACEDAILSLSPDGTITSWNAGAERILGYHSSEVIGKPKSALFPPDHMHEWLEMLDRLPQGSRTDTVETVRLHKCGIQIPVSVTTLPIFDMQGRLVGATVVMRDLSARRQSEALQREADRQRGEIEQLVRRQAELEEANTRMEVLATTDRLTGLSNRCAFQARVQQEVARARRYGTLVSVIRLDVDKFKQHIDSEGHAAGDAVICRVAEILRQTARTSDVIARYGGEEFAVLLPETNAEQAGIAGERYRYAIATTANLVREVTVSVGAATLLSTTPDADALLADADAALHCVHNRGHAGAKGADASGALSLESSHWFDGLLQNLLAAQTETLGTTSDQVQETLFRAYDATIESWSRILDLKDKETEGHSERVTDLMVRLVRHLNMNEREVQYARWGAWLHDIGKIATPDAILHKPGPLTDEEWVIMRRHTTEAYDMLKPIAFLGPAVDIPYCHHEKWNGTGYPRGLKGDEIPLLALLFAVIDVYDALCSDRPYHKAMPEPDVRDYLREQAGIHFDPRAVSAFLAMLEARDAERNAA